jgi:hypothetical protein
MSSETLKAVDDGGALVEERTDAWLRGDSTKLLLSSLDGLRKARRASMVLLWSVSAYVAVAGIGQLEGRLDAEMRMDEATRNRGTAERAASLARDREKADFDEYLRSRDALEERKRDVTLTGKDTDIAKTRLEQKRDAVADSQKRLHMVETVLATARATLAAFDQNHIPGDNRVLAERNVLVAKVGDASAAVESARRVLITSEEEGRAAAGIAGRSQAEVLSPIDAQAASRRALAELADMTQERLRARNQWRLTQRDVDEARVNLSAATARCDQLVGAPKTVTLPILNLGVRPLLFFRFAPVLLLLLYWNCARCDRKVVTESAEFGRRTIGRMLDEKVLSTAIPELFWARNDWLSKVGTAVPDVAVFGTLALLLWSNDPWAPGGALLGAVLALTYRLWARRKCELRATVADRVDP